LKKRTLPFLFPEGEVEAGDILAGGKNKDGKKERSSNNVSCTHNGFVEWFAEDAF